MTFPLADAHSFQRAAKESTRLVEDATLITRQIASSLSFAQRIMQAAEQSDTTSVIRLLKQIGVKSNIDIRFSPEGIRIYLSLSSSRLFLLLRWGT
ncbi:inner spore coat protein [Bacillus sp. Bos-x628]|uniref:inner spore coat protein n=1 Tax=Bacillus maqinnsis TaxID=3229854 RepID=UPI00338FAD76